MDRKLKRRDFIKLSSVAVLGTVAAACAPQVTPPPPAEPTKAPEAPKPADTKAPEAPKPAEPTKVIEQPTAPAGFKEAPMLADMVKGGKLPPVEERLPASSICHRKS